MKQLLDIAYNRYEECKLDVYLPETENFKTMIYFHGGGLEFHGRNGEHTIAIAQSFVAQGYAFVSADYRIYPNAKAPEFIQDAAEAVAFVKEHIPNWGGNGEILISGQSAGAWLSLMLCVDKKYLQAVGMDSEEICGWIIDSAQTTSHFNVLRKDLGVNPNAQRINEYAPQYFVDENLKFSKMLLIFYEKDMPCRPEQNMLFYKSILTFSPQADIEYQMLEGGHCHGSSKKDEDGEYPYVKTSLKWLKEKGL